MEVPQALDSPNPARSPSGKAEVCKTSIGGSIPPRASSICSRYLLPT
jgi:hypothetical protein